MDYLNPLNPGTPALIAGGTVMVYHGVQAHKPLLTIIGLCVVALGSVLLLHLARRQRRDARAAGL
jgi:hypothetical protein